MRISAFSVIKNEAQFIGYGLMSILPYVDEVVYFDGNSTDGTLRLLDHIKTKYDSQNKIKVFLDKDFKDFKEDYVRVFNECMKACTGDYLFYIHPDIILTDPGKLIDRKNWNELAYYTNIRSFAGEDLDLEIVKGRTDKWKTIMKNCLGLKYWGHYGHTHEDMYHTAITGDRHVVYKNMKDYPYVVGDSGIKIWHFCECKPRKRREQKMETVIRTNIKSDEVFVKDALVNHPRIHLQNQKGIWGYFEFTQRVDPLPDVFAKHKDEFEAVLR